MTQYISWRWVFWTTSIFDAVVQIACIILLRETHHPTVLANKVKALKKSTGNQELHTKWQGPEHTMKKRLMKSCVRPWIMLTTQPALQAMALFRGYQYGLMYLVFATFPMVFEDAYDQDTGRASLNYLSLGIGFVIGLQISGTMQDKIYTWCKVNEIDPSTSLRHSFLQSWKLLFQKNKKQNNNKQGKGNLLLLLQRRQKSHSLPTKQDEETPHSNIPRKPVPNRINSITRRGTNKSFVDPTKGLPEYRLPLLLPFSMLIPIGKLLTSKKPPLTHSFFLHPKPLPSLTFPISRPLPLRLDSRIRNPLDSPQHRHLHFLHRPDRLLQLCARLRRRYLHHLRRLCHGRCSFCSNDGRIQFSAVCAQNVQGAGRRLGEFCFGVCEFDAGVGGACGVVEIWGLVEE